MADINITIQNNAGVTVNVPPSDNLLAQVITLQQQANELLQQLVIGLTSQTNNQ